MSINCSVNQGFRSSHISFMQICTFFPFCLKRTEPSRDHMRYLSDGLNAPNVLSKDLPYFITVFIFGLVLPHFKHHRRSWDIDNLFAN